MSIEADMIREEAAELRRRAVALDAIAARIDGQTQVAAVIGDDHRADAIVRAICANAGMPVAKVLTAGRRENVVFVRDCCAHALTMLLHYGAGQVADALCWREHGACYYALDRVRTRRQLDKRYAADLERAMKAARAALAKLEGLAA